MDLNELKPGRLYATGGTMNGKVKVLELEAPTAAFPAGRVKVARQPYGIVRHITPEMIVSTWADAERARKSSPQAIAQRAARSAARALEADLAQAGVAAKIGVSQYEPFSLSISVHPKYADRLSELIRTGKNLTSPADSALEKAYAETLGV